MQTAYADESGDTGYIAGASPLFVLTAFLPLEPEALITCVIGARRKLGKPETFEFHFRQGNNKILNVFFDAIASQPITLLVAAIHKGNAPNVLQRRGKVGLYIHSLGGLALRSPVTLNNVKLHIDGTGSQKSFVRALTIGVRRICQESGRREQGFKEIRILSSAHPLIQCADMLAGAASEQARASKSVWLNKLNLKELVWWEEEFTV
ncbi:MAG: DUF3800 domain-containing protein [Chloroflexota bacterium]